MTRQWKSNVLSIFQGKHHPTDGLRYRCLSTYSAEIRESILTLKLNWYQVQLGGESHFNNFIKAMCVVSFFCAKPCSYTSTTHTHVLFYAYYHETRVLRLGFCDSGSHPLKVCEKKPKHPIYTHSSPWLICRPLILYVCPGNTSALRTNIHCCSQSPNESRLAGALSEMGLSCCSFLSQIPFLAFTIKGRFQGRVSAVGVFCCFLRKCWLLRYASRRIFSELVPDNGRGLHPPT